jgi:hypothetical protein
MLEVRLTKGRWLYVFREDIRSNGHPLTVISTYPAWMARRNVYRSEKGTQKEAHQTKHHNTRYHVGNQPENKLHRKANECVQKKHSPLSKSMCRLSEKESSQKYATI